MEAMVLSNFAGEGPPAEPDGTDPAVSTRFNASNPSVDFYSPLSCHWPPPHAMRACKQSASHATAPILHHILPFQHMQEAYCTVSNAYSLLPSKHAPHSNGSYAGSGASTPTTASRRHLAATPQQEGSKEGSTHGSPASPGPAQDRSLDKSRSYAEHYRVAKGTPEHAGDGTVAMVAVGPAPGDWLMHPTTHPAPAAELLADELGADEDRLDSTRSERSWNAAAALRQQPDSRCRTPGRSSSAASLHTGSCASFTPSLQGSSAHPPAWMLMAQQQRTFAVARIMGTKRAKQPTRLRVGFKGGLLGIGRQEAGKRKPWLITRKYTSEHRCLLRTISSCLKPTLATQV